MKENDIRPKDIFDKYLEIARNDIKIYFDNSIDFVAVDCPACNSKELINDFGKENFTYKKCKICETLFVSPRPTQDSIDRYYRNSASSKYWTTVFYKKTEAARREKLFKPKTRMLKDLTRKYTICTEKHVDIGAGYGTFCEEIIALKFTGNTFALEPSIYLSDSCRKKGLEVIESTVENIDKKYYNYFDFATSLELFEHVFSVETFLNSVKKILKKRGYFVFTTLNGKGWDILTLGKNSKSLSPPHHLNFLNPKAVKILAERLRWSVVEIFTPGKIDVDIVVNFAKEKPLVQFDKFTEYIIKQDDKTKDAFQKFLAENCMSSHMWVVLRKE